MTIKELRKELRELKNEPYRKELQIGNRIVISTGDKYGIKAVNDESDPYTDYCAYTFGFREKYIIDRAITENLVEV